MKSKDKTMDIQEQIAILKEIAERIGEEPEPKSAESLMQSFVAIARNINEELKEAVVLL